MKDGWVIHTCKDLCEVEQLLRELAAKDRENVRELYALDPGHQVYFRDCVAQQESFAEGYRLTLLTSVAANDPSAA